MSWQQRWGHWLMRRWKWLERFFASPHTDRLRAALDDAHNRLEKIKAMPQPDPALIKACEDCLKKAEVALGDGASFVAWDCVHRFDAEALGAMTADERAARWYTLRTEAKDKLKGTWRGQATDAIVSQAPNDKAIQTDAAKLPLQLLRELQMHLAVAAQNTQFKLELFERRTLPLIALALVAAVAITLVIAAQLSIPDSFLATRPWLGGLDPAEMNQWARALTMGVSSGALGGILSMSFSLGRTDLKAKIPELRLSRWATITRPFLGAAVAIPIVVLVQTDFVTIKGIEGLPEVFAFCLLGGYSERWFLGVMGNLEAGKK